MQIEDLFIQVGNIKTRYWELGESGSPVLFVHGLGSFIEHWKQNLIAFSKHYRVYALDLIGFGLTEKPTISYSIPFLAKFVQDFMNSKGIQSASLIGNSLGSMIAIELNLLNPNIVEKLILLNGGFWGKEIGIAFRILSVPFVGEWLMRPNRDGTEKFLKRMFFDQSLVTKELIDITFELNSQPKSTKAYLDTLRSGVNILGVKRALVNRTLENKNRLTSPTLIIWGKNDNVLPVKYAYKAANLLPNTTLRVLDNCGHMPQIKCAAEFNNLALSFLAKLH